MSVHDDLARAQGSLAKLFGETITPLDRRLKPCGDPIPATITNPTAETAFEAGIELKDGTIMARVAKPYLETPPAIQSLWLIRGKNYRLTKPKNYPSSTLLVFNSPKHS